MYHHINVTLSVHDIFIVLLPIADHPIMRIPTFSIRHNIAVQAFSWARLALRTSLFARLAVSSAFRALFLAFRTRLISC